MALGAPGISNNRLEILLDLQDQASKKFDQVSAKMKKESNSLVDAFKKNWAAITAAAVAAFLAIQKAWQSLELSAKFEQTKQAFANVAASFGANADQIVRDLKKASAETISTMDLMQKASQAMILGISPDKLAQLMEVARASARAMGQDMTFMFESIVTGIGRQSKLILDNLGIVFSASQAYEDYAKSIGKSAKDLTDLEKKQAFVNATLKAGKDILDRVNVEQKTHAEMLQTIKARWADMTVVIGNALWKIVGAFQVLSDTLASGFAFILEQIFTLGKGLMWLVEKIPLIGDKFEGAKEHMEEFRAIMDEWGQVSATSAMENWENLTASVVEGSGIMASSISQVADAADQAKDKMADWQTKFTEAQTQMSDLQGNLAGSFLSTFKGISTGFGKAIGDMLIFGKNFGLSMKNLFKQMAADFISKIASMLIEWAIMSTVGQVIMTAVTAASTAMAATIAAAWAPAAAMVSLATFGANAGPAAAGMATAAATAQGLAVITPPKKMALGGEGIVDKPTWFLAGEAGPERFNFTPLGKGGGPSGGQIINIEINNPIVREDNDIDALVEEISNRLAREAERIA